MDKRATKEMGKEVYLPHEEKMNELLIIATRQGRDKQLDEAGVRVIYYHISELSKEWKKRFTNIIPKK